MDERTAHPYIPNSIPSVRDAMLEAIGAANVEELYADIPPSSGSTVRSTCRPLCALRSSSSVTWKACWGETPVPERR